MAKLMVISLFLLIDKSLSLIRYYIGGDIKAGYEVVVKTFTSQAAFHT
jgi:hypothetical protein